MLNDDNVVISVLSDVISIIVEIPLVPNDVNSEVKTDVSPVLKDVISVVEISLVPNDVNSDVKTDVSPVLKDVISDTVVISVLADVISGIVEISLVPKDVNCDCTVIFLEMAVISLITLVPPVVYFSEENSVVPGEHNYYYMQNLYNCNFIDFL